MKQMRGVPAVRILKVYGRYGFLRFGPEDDIIPYERIRQITKERTTEFQFEEHGAALRLFVPMVNDDRCQVCHGSKWPMRGVIVLEFKRNELAHIAADIDQRFTTALQMVVTEGFRSIMLVGRANSTRFYLDELRTMPIFESVRVFDNKGGERFLNPPPRKLMATQAAEHRDTVEYTYAVDGESFLVRAEPVLNEQRCFACHASAQKVRGVVEVRSSLADIHAEIQRNQYRSLAVALVTFGLVWLVIRYFMRSMVVKPVQLIENVATRVGRGDFTVRASVDSKDEIGSLARQINEMVVGLRERFHLQKFVSQQTVVTIRQNEAGVDMTAGRKTATVFFSDIRGFTSYSERTKPERVIAMLNACLSTQAAIIGKHGGDIDNYVGDEVFAVFEGEGMVERAVRAALEIQTTVISSLQQTDRKAINIGIGINTGEMVMGALGSEERKALTVIGDNVNLGARLCGAAKGKQILLSETSAKHLIGHPEFAVKKLRPIEVKGKRAPINIFEVRSKKSLSKKQKQ
ncbi:MAG: adenylate/guanylate cyclase domain-containing protein [Ignavibacteriales bacterium]|nr:adenylate/guanylate cyclase domain-containing protein [Ignavibacteriales bacterium]